MQASNYLSQMKKLNFDELVEIQSFGPIISQNIIDYINNPAFDKLIQDMQRLEETNKGLDLIITATTQNLPQICITGKFDIPRPQIAKLLEAKGYSIVNSVTKTTKILIAGTDAGSKTNKAQKLGIQIIDNYQPLL
jgi:DNA ligase (NAD+)